MRNTIPGRAAARLFVLTCGIGSASLTATPVLAQDLDLDAIKTLVSVEGPGKLMHCDAAVRSRNFQDIFFCGDKLFETPFTAQDGIGANVGNGQRFARFPHAELNAPGQWATQLRTTGPNADSCINCHNRPAADAAGDASSNNVRDPMLKADSKLFIQRNPTSTEGRGVLQRLTEEINEDLQQVVANATDMAKSSNAPVTLPLTSKGIDFGKVTVAANGTATIDAQGVDPDLVPKFFDRKGIEPKLRGFIRGAFLNELGLGPVEFYADKDVDADGVVNEITIADVTAMTLYQAAQQPPTTRTQLSQFREQLNGMGRAGQTLAGRLRLPTVTPQEVAAVGRGATAFEQIGCTDCHRPSLPLRSRTFSEPSRNPNFRDKMLPAGQDPVRVGLDPQNPITVDLGSTGVDGPQDNVFRLGNQNVKVPNALVSNGDGADVAVLTDLRFHDMGPVLAEPVDSAVEGGLVRGNSTFMTAPLWGVGSSPPYLHDGRAPTLTEAILAHGGESQASRDAFAALATAAQKDIIAFLIDKTDLNMEGDAEEAREGAEGDDDLSGDDDDD